ncbi:MAG: hypothetical protein KGL18_04800 [Burkholderiales bacterium]|nr:hypothetical protein [Burkholderiales bacterium]MDE2502283.1 hypothetical protein [Burkholderiales bacterium]
MLAELLHGAAPQAWRLIDLVLVDYADALGAAPPTWVAAALAAAVPR